MCLLAQNASVCPVIRVGRIARQRAEFVRVRVTDPSINWVGGQALAGS